MPKGHAYPVKIIDSRVEDGVLQFKVLWRGYKDPTWEPSYNLRHRTDLIDKFKESYLFEGLRLENRIWIYCRISSEKQNLPDHTSLLVQERICLNFIRENRWRGEVRVIKEVMSAKNMKKQRNLNEIFHEAASGDKILFHDTSRFSRNTSDGLNFLQELSNRGVSITFVKERLSYDNPQNRQFIRQKLSAAQAYSEEQSERVKASIKFRKERGDFMGRSAPFGFKVVREPHEQGRTRRTIVPDPQEMEIVEFIRSKSKGSVLGANKIATDLNQRGISLRGRKITFKDVQNIITRFKTDLKKRYR